MTTLTFVYPASANPPLTCDCQGAPLYIRFKGAYGSVTRDGTGVAHGTLGSRQQLADGTWAYSIYVHEADLITPIPQISSGMVQSICCQGCQGFVLEALDTAEFGGRLVLAEDSIATGKIFVRRFIRPFRLSDFRIFLDQEASADVTARLWVNGVDVMSTAITVPAGSKYNSLAPVFSDGLALIIPENAVLEIEITADGSLDDGYTVTPAALGLEVWGYGHLNPGPTMLLNAGGGSIPGSDPNQPRIELVTVDGAKFAKVTMPTGQEFFIPGFPTLP